MAVALWRSTQDTEKMFQEIEACPFSSLIFVSFLLVDNALWYNFLQRYTFFGLCFFFVLSTSVYSCLSNISHEKRMNAVIPNLKVLIGQREGQRSPSYRITLLERCGREVKSKRKVRKAAFRDPNSDVKCIGEGNKALKVAVTGEESNKR